MAIIDTYRSAVTRRREELAKLKQDLSKEQSKESDYKKKKNAATTAISHTKNSSTIKTKSREIDRYNDEIAKSSKRQGDIMKSISKKEKELNDAISRVEREEARIEKQKEAVQKKLQEETVNQMATIENTLSKHEEVQQKIQQDIEQLQAVPQNITVLFLASNPTDTNSLKLDEEVREIQQRIRLSEYRDSISFQSRWAVRSSDILQAIDETNPTIIHFSGHGTDVGDLVLMNTDGSAKIVSKEAITAAISTASDTVRLVVFNACFSESQAANIVNSIDAAIGMSDSVRDDAAVVFAAQLYSSLGFGHSIQKAFLQAKAALMLEGIPGADIPHLYSREGIDINEMILVAPDVAKTN